MKTYHERTQDILEHIEKYKKQKRQQRKQIYTAVSLAACLTIIICAAIVFPSILHQPVIPPGPNSGDTTSVHSPSSSEASTEPNSSTVLPTSTVETRATVGRPSDSNTEIGDGHIVTLEEARTALGLTLNEPVLCRIQELRFFQKQQEVSYTLEKDGQTIGSVVIGKGERTIDTARYQPVENSYYPFYIGYDSFQYEGANIRILLNWEGIHYNGVFQGITEVQILSIMESLIVA